MGFWLGMLIGTFLGASLGALMIGLCNAAAYGDEHLEER